MLAAVELGARDFEAADTRSGMYATLGLQGTLTSHVLECPMTQMLICMEI